MPISYSIEGRVLYVLCEGIYSHRDIFALTERALADPNFQAPMYLLGDARKTKQYDSAAQLNELAHFFGSIRSQFVNHWSLVVEAESEMSYGLTKLLALMLKLYGIDLNVYASVEEARAGIEAFEQAQARRTRKKK